MHKDENVCYYVAQDGCDDWSGQLPRPDAEGADGPFATLGKAVEAHRKNNGRKPARIIVDGGSYYDVSVKLTEENSGLVIEAARGSSPVLYGGRKIAGWKKEEDGDFWYAELPEAGRGGWDFRLLVVNGRLCGRSRLPEEGTYEHLTRFNVEWTSTSGGGWARKPTYEELTTVKYKPEDLGPWLDANNAELSVYHRWDESLAGVAAHDTGRHELRLSNPCGHPPGSFECYKYVVWNTREGMTGPGQWYFDRTRGRLVYRPLMGEDMEKAEVIAPTTDTILNFTEKTTGVVVRGLTFSVTNTPLIAAEFAAVKLPGAVQASEGLVDCSFEKLTIKNTGGHGIKIFGCCRSVGIKDCEISFTGAGGIIFQNNMKEIDKEGIEIVAPCVPAAGIEDQTGCIITNNHVHHVGTVCSSAIAISGHCCAITHNEISDTPYSGICYGTFSGQRYGGRNGLVENNVILRAMQVLNDGAAIYATFTMEGIMRGNVVKDIRQSGEDGSIRNALYLDENTEGWLMEENLVVNCSHPVLNHMARRNTIRNNIFACNTYLQVNIIRCKEYSVEHNIIYSKDKVVFENNPDAVVNMNKNLIYSCTGVYVESYINDSYQKYDLVPLRFRDGSVTGDPLFKDADGGDFTLSEDSPAFALGIRNVDISKAGRLKHE